MNMGAYGLRRPKAPCAQFTLKKSFASHFPFLRSEGLIRVIYGGRQPRYLRRKIANSVFPSHTDLSP